MILVENNLVLLMISYLLIHSEQVITVSKISKKPSKLFHTSLRRALSLCPDLIVGRQRTIKQPALFNFCNIPDEDLIPSLKYLMENNPIGFPVLVTVPN